MNSEKGKVKDLPVVAHLKTYMVVARITTDTNIPTHVRKGKDLPAVAKKPAVDYVLKPMRDT